MRPLLSEFSFGYALTEELASGAFGPLIGAPIFPSLIQEGRPGGGYDLHLPLVGAPLFLQFKLSDCMVYRSAREWDLFNRSYYRMHLRPGRHSDQHALLCTLETSGEEVYYVAPYFHTTEELNTHYSNQTVAENSIWFRPSTIGALPDDNDHYIAFDRATPTAYFCSKDHRPLDAKLNIASVAERQSERYHASKRQLDKQFFTRIADEILGMSAGSKEAAPQLQTERFTNSRRRTKKQEAQFAAFLSRSLLNAELFIIADPNDSNES